MNATLPALVNGFILSVPLAAAVWLALRLGRRSLNAATRYGVCWIALAACMALPLFYQVPIGLHAKPAQDSWVPHTPSLRVGSLEGPFAPAQSTQDANAITQPALTVPDSPSVPTADAATARIKPVILSAAKNLSAYFPSLPIPVRLPSGTWPARTVKPLAELWALVSLLLFMRLAASFAILHSQKKRAAEAPQALRKTMERCLSACGISRRQVRIAVVKSGDSPMVAGPLSPCVLIPARLLSALDDAEMEQICLHEAAHLARYDDWSLLLQRTIEALFVFHPIVRWIARRIDLEREIACDDFVIAATGQPRPYASCLAHVAELAVGYSASPVAAAVVDEKSHLTRRITMLLDKTRYTGTHILKLRLAAALLALVFLTWFAGRSPALFALAPPQPIPVSIPVTVADPYGRLVVGLEKSNFQVFEDDVEQEISSFHPGSNDSISVKDVMPQIGSQGLLTAITELQGERVDRRALVIVTDPNDQLMLSESETNALVRKAAEAGVELFTISVTEDGKAPPSAFTDATGNIQTDASPANLAEMEQRIHDGVQNEYVIGYVPKSQDASRAYRRIQVWVTHTPPLVWHAPSGYYWSSPPAFALAAQPQPTQPPAAQQPAAPLATLAASSLPTRRQSAPALASGAPIPSAQQPPAAQSLPEKNQFKTVQTAASQDQRAQDIDDALQKLDQLQRQMDQLARNSQQSSSASAQGSTSSPSQPDQASPTPPDVQQALDRLRQAQQDMERAASQQQQAQEAARNAADQLREATNALQAQPQLQPSFRAPINLNMTNDSKTVFETVAKLAGLTVIFDPNFTSRPITFDAVNVTIEQLLDIISIQAKASWKPVSNTIILVAPATQIGGNGAIEMLTPTQGVNFDSYLQHVVESVKRNWNNLMPESVYQGDKGRVVVQFRIMRDGSVEEPRLIGTSNKQPLDLAAAGAIRVSSPFESLPSAFTGPNIELRFTFFYNMGPNDQMPPENGTQSNPGPGNARSNTQQPAPSLVGNWHGKFNWYGKNELVEITFSKNAAGEYICQLHIEPGQGASSAPGVPFVAADLGPALALVVGNTLHLGASDPRYATAKFAYDGTLSTDGQEIAGHIAFLSLSPALAAPLSVTVEREIDTPVL